MPSSIIFFDIDGTILDADNSIPESAVAAIRNCRTRGNVCVVNTGRPYSHIEKKVKEIGFDGYICSCGEHIILNGRTVFRKTMEPQLCRKVVDNVQMCGLDGIYESEEGYGFSEAGEKHNNEMFSNIERFKERGYPDYYDIEKNCFFDKFCVWGYEKDSMEVFLEFARQYFEVIHRSEMMYECVIKGCSKESGIRAMMEIGGVDFENSYALGDSNNDLPMLRYVSHSIAMGNAPESVKREAEFVTKSITEDGLAWALKEMGLC